MRLTPSPSCQRLFQHTKYLQPGDSSAITFPTQCLSFQSLSFCFTFSQCVFLCSHGRFPAWGFIPPHTRTLWKCVAVAAAVEALMEGQLVVALALHSWTHAGTWQRAWWWYWQNSILQGTTTEGSKWQEEVPPELSQKENTHRRSGFAVWSLLSEPSPFPFPVPQTSRVVRPLLSRLVLDTNTDVTGSLWGTWGTLRNETVLKERRELWHFQTLFRATPLVYCPESRDRPSKTARSKEQGKKERWPHCKCLQTSSFSAAFLCFTFSVLLA